MLHNDRGVLEESGVASPIAKRVSDTFELVKPQLRWMLKCTGVSHIIAFINNHMTFNSTYNIEHARNDSFAIFNLLCSGFGQKSVVDLKWRLDYHVRSSTTGVEHVPVYFVSIKTVVSFFPLPCVNHSYRMFT